jgi:hypothetical protein
MNSGEVTGIISKCIQVNYRIVPELVSPLIPKNLSLRTHGGFAIAGVCIVQFKKVRAMGRMEILGTNYEACAHRIAVMWKDAQGQLQQGTHIIHRHASSQMKGLGGGWIFSEETALASFENDEADPHSVKMKSKDGKVAFSFYGKPSTELSLKSGFNFPDEISTFYSAGHLGKVNPGPWRFEPMEFENTTSTVFNFAEDSCFLDSALIARDTRHIWKSEQDLYW